jgi:4-hydroxy-4-methyl-2-oxoglutarate aldolase
MSELLDLGAATLGETGGRPMHPRIKAVWPGARLAAPAYVVTLGEGDNLAIHAAVVAAPAGAALVVAADPPGLGYWGEVLTTAAQSRGLAGLVIDGGVRDVDALERLQFPVFSALIALQGAGKVSGGEIGGSAPVGDVVITTGDWVVGDRDGVTVIPASSFDAVLAAGRARFEKEAAMFTQLRAGATTVSLLGLDTSPVHRA